MLAAGALNGYAMPAFADATLDEIRHFVHEAGARFMLAEDQEQVDKILDLRDQGATIEHIIYDDPRGLNAYPNPGLISWETVQAKGAERLAADPSLRDALIQRAQPEGPAVFVHSSGSTGKPKGVVLSHRNLLAGVRNAYRGGAFQFDEDDPGLSADRLGRRLRRHHGRRHRASLHHQHSRAAGNGAAQSARDRADLLSGRAAQLGQSPDRDPGSHGRFVAAEEIDLSVLHGRQPFQPNGENSTAASRH